jgi:mono/diheme cytochrome c family protein
MCLRVLTALIVVPMLVAALGCARQQEAPDVAPAVAPLPDTTESAQPDDTEAAPPEATAGDEGQHLYETKCAQCHTLDRVGKHDPAEEPWPEVVKEMQAKKPGSISDEDAAVIVQHLETTYGAP